MTEGGDRGSENKHESELKKRKIMGERIGKGGEVRESRWK